MNIELLKEQIKRHEGEILEIYEDSLGYLIGVGHLIREDDEEFVNQENTPVSQEVVDRYYDADFDKHVDETIHVCENNNIDFDNLPEDIQHVLVNMCFNMGYNRLSNLEICCMQFQLVIGKKCQIKWKILDGMDKWAEEVKNYINWFSYGL